MTNAPANQTETSKLTQATYDRLVAELEDLTTRGRVEIAQAIEAARALGDLSENGDYHAAKDSQGKMESRIRQLQAMLKDAEIVDESGADDGSVSSAAPSPCATRVTTRTTPSSSSWAPSRSAKGICL